MLGDENVLEVESGRSLYDIVTIIKVTELETIEMENLMLSEFLS